MSEPNPPIRVGTRVRVLSHRMGNHRAVDYYGGQDGTVEAIETHPVYRGVPRFVVRMDARKWPARFTADQLAVLAGDEP